MLGTRKNLMWITSTLYSYILKWLKLVSMNAHNILNRPDKAIKLQSIFQNFNDSSKQLFTKNTFPT